MHLPLRKLVAACALLRLSHASSVFNCVGGSVYVVAHPDDDILFQAPDLTTDALSGTCITTVFMTSGDAGLDSAYPMNREAGNEAATAQMVGVVDDYKEFNATFGGQLVLVRTLAQAPQHQKVWFRLPDGNMDGAGYSSTGFDSLRELYFGTITSLTNQPGYSTYTLATLKQALSEILAARAPERVRTLDYLSDYDCGDHSDHLTTARIVQSVVGIAAPQASLQGYMGYPISSMPPTMKESDANFTRKNSAFASYAAYDSAECADYSACETKNRGEASWLLRQYVVTPALKQSSTVGSSQSVSVVPGGKNLALAATATASNAAAGQPASNAIDGVAKGYPGNASAEWASEGGRSGAWLSLTFPSAITVGSIVLFDRPNTDDWITSGFFTFSDGSGSSFAAINNDGSATVFNLSTPVLTSSVRMTVGTVSADTTSVGLAEMQVYAPSSGSGVVPGTASAAVVNNASSATSTSSAQASYTAAMLAASSSSKVASPALPTFTSATAISAAQSTSSPIASSTTVEKNLARNATASSSSELRGQEAWKAIDGNIGGYPGDPSVEWSSAGAKSGTTLTLRWSTDQVFDTVVLYDRPNGHDHITAASLSVSDGSGVGFGPLNNDGSGTVISLPVKTSRVLVFRVVSASDTTTNVGLSEIEVFYRGGKAA